MPPRSRGNLTAMNNVELAYVPFYGPWLNRIEAEFTALRSFALNGTDHPSHRKQASIIRRYIAWRNRHATDARLRGVIRRAETIKRARRAVLDSSLGHQPHVVLLPAGSSLSGGTYVDVAAHRSGVVLLCGGGVGRRRGRRGSLAWWGCRGRVGASRRVRRRAEEVGRRRGRRRWRG